MAAHNPGPAYLLGVVIQRLRHLLLVLATLPACADVAGKEGDAVGEVCPAGEEIFCRCQNGDPGTKTCASDGYGFGSCGPCDGSHGPGDVDPGSGGAGGGGSGGGGAAAPTPLLGPCSADAECESGNCSMGYCTRTCAAPIECPKDSACVHFDAKTQICMPTCGDAGDCSAFGSKSDCGWAAAVDGAPSTACADWPSLALPPPGSDCSSDSDCNLGHDGAELVCSTSGACAVGCHVQSDCPQGQTCSGSTALKTCS